MFLRVTFQDLKISFFPFNTVFPLNIILYQLSYSPGNYWFTIQQKKDGILHDLFRCWRCKSCANSLTISLKRIVMINHGILCQSQSQVTATLPTKHWFTKKSQKMHFTCASSWQLLIDHFRTHIRKFCHTGIGTLHKQTDSTLHLLNILDILTVNNLYQHNALKFLHLWQKGLLEWIYSKIIFNMQVVFMDTTPDMPPKNLCKP